MNERNRTSRRDFLKRASAAAVGVPYVITSSMRRAGAAPANDRIVMGVIGPGKRGLGVMKSFIRFPNIQMVATCDASRARRDHARKVVENRYASEKDRSSFKGCTAYADFRELLARKDIDAVLIATPDHWHAIPVIEAAKLRKDIYCEKPLSLTIHEAHMMVEAVRKHGCIFQTGSQQRSEYGGQFRRACELVRNGRIGKVRTVHVGVGGPSKDCDLPTQPVPDGLDWNFWLGPAPFRGYHERLCPAGIPEKPKPEDGDIPYYTHYPAWRAYKDYSGGGMTDIGAHHFDIAQWGLGMDGTGPVEIIPPDGKERKLLTYKYANGVIMYHGGRSGITFTGTDGVIEVDRGRFKAEPESVAKEPIPEDGVHLYKSDNHVRNFIDCVISRERPICDVEIGAGSVTVCHLGNLAYWHKRRLRWNPEQWHFVGDDEANTWLDRPKRDPWKLPKI